MTGEREGGTAFVLGGGGLLGASELGMLRALFDTGRRPDLVVGTSIGALNGAVIAADPTPSGVDTLTAMWQQMAGNEVFAVGLGRLRDVARHRTHLQPIAPLRKLLERTLDPVRDFEELPIPFQCCAASIERAAETWFSTGHIATAVSASCAVPGLFPPVRIEGEHYLDGGIVNSIPVGRAIDLGASTVYVLHVGRVDQPLEVPTRPWEVASVAFEIARRHRFAHDMALVPPQVSVHVLPTGDTAAPAPTMRYRNAKRARFRAKRAYESTRDYLAKLDRGEDPGEAGVVEAGVAPGRDDGTEG